MPDLVPNGPKERIAYVIKTYRNTKTRFIIPVVIEASLSLIGQDHAAARFAAEYRPLLLYLFSGLSDRLAAQMLDEGFASPSRFETRELGLPEPDVGTDQFEAYVDALFDQMPRAITVLVPDIPRHHPLDFVIPWMAKELNRLGKAVLSRTATERDFEDAAMKLNLVGPAIGMWAQQNRIDLTKTTLAEALEGIKDFDVEADEEMPQGDVVYNFDDGWTIQRLVTREQLTAEGEAMQHCVGGYHDLVSTGRSAIFSLRDPGGQPHATIEWSPPRPLGPSDTMRSKRVGAEPVLAGYGQFEQIRGKQNALPAPKYRERIQKFINDRFGGDPLGTLLVAMPGQRVDFRGHTLEGLVIGELFEWDERAEANFSGAKLVSCIFPVLDGVIFDDARLEKCVFEGRLDRCGFINADIQDCIFADVYHCDFVDASVNGAGQGGRGTFNGEIGWSNLRGANFRRVIFKGTLLYIDDLDMAQMEECVLLGVDISNCSMNGFEFKGENVLSGVSISGLDLSDVNDHTAAAFRNTAVGREVTWPDEEDVAN